MAGLHRSATTLRIGGDTLTPDEISRLLGARPSFARTKGEQWKGKVSGRVYTARTGQWRLGAEDRKPADIDGQIAEILNQLTPDLDVWASLSERFKIDLFCGWFMEDSSEGVEISAASLRALGLRGIVLGVCLYAPAVDTETERST